MAERFTAEVQVDGKTATFFAVPEATVAALGAGGQQVEVTVELDTEPRVAEVPPELAEALAAAPAAAARFGDLSYSHQREYCEWVADAKKAETRTRRAGKAVTMLADGQTLR